MEMLPTEKGEAVDDTGWRQGEKENQEVTFGQVEFEMSIRHSNEEAESGNECVSLRLRRKVWLKI